MSGKIGIEAMNVYGGVACIDVRELATHRGLEASRFDNLLMKEKTVVLPFEDPITFAVNAAKPMLDGLPDQSRERIDLLITCTESGIDFGKSVSTYVHDQLGLSRHCRLIELKQACYSATAGLQLAASHVLANAVTGGKALVIATDVSRFRPAPQHTGPESELTGQASEQDWSFAEPSGGSGAVAMLVGDEPGVFRIDLGASGYYGYEVMDTCRPYVNGEAGDADLSLMSYLDCLEAAYEHYRARVEGVDFATSFKRLIFHTPFGGMVKGAHRTIMRRAYRMPPGKVEEDFQRRVAPGLDYCQRVGNIMGGSIFLALASTIEQGGVDRPMRIGCFAYGSGCCSEFFSGVTTPQAREILAPMRIAANLDRRVKLSMSTYDRVLAEGDEVGFGTRNVTVGTDLVPEARAASQSCGRLSLSRIEDFHRSYEWS